MRPELFSLFGIGVPSYFALLITGFLFATGAGVLWARRIGQNPDVIVDLGLVMLISGVAGSRILHVLADGHFWDYVHVCTDRMQVDWPLDQASCVSKAYGGQWDPVTSKCHPGTTDCLLWAKFYAGGLTYYGGFIGATLAAYLLLKRDRFPFWKAADMAGFAIPIGLAFGRVGCLLAGCCFGSTCRLPWAISFPGRSQVLSASPAVAAQVHDHLVASEWSPSLPVHPTQVYEALASLGIAAIALYVVHPRKRYDGQVFAAFLVMYAGARFAIEVLRRDERGGWLGLSTSQLIGVALVVSAAILHVLRSPKSRLRPTAAA